MSRPGPRDHLEARDQQGGHQAARQNFTAQLVKAIRDLDERRANRTSEHLSASAWDKLQYDYPLLEQVELAALVDAFRCGPTTPPCPLLVLRGLNHAALRRAAAVHSGHPALAAAMQPHHPPVHPPSAPAGHQCRPKRAGSHIG